MPNSPYQKRGKSLTWSNTRITLLEYCERKYYLNYYTFALKEPHPELWTEALVLKGLKSMEMRIGEKSHYLLSDYLHLLKQHTTAALALDEKVQEIKQQLKAEMEAEFAFSKARNYQDDKNFFGKFGLSEHFYGEDKDTALQPAIEKVLANLDHFIASKWNEKVQDYFTSAKFIYIEHPRVPDYNAMKVDISQLPGLEQIAVLASPDFGAMLSDTEYLILDWKSGKEDFLADEISDQLKVYALKMLLKKRRTSLEGMNIHAYEIYLGSMNAYGGTITQAHIDTIITKIGQDVDYMKQFLDDQDPIKNVPLDPFIFRKTSSEKKCETCTFRAICKHLL